MEGAAAVVDVITSGVAGGGDEDGAVAGFTGDVVVGGAAGVVVTSLGFDVGLSGSITVTVQFRQVTGKIEN